MISTPGEVSLIESWPSLKAVRKVDGGKAWAKFTPVFRLLRPKSLPVGDDSFGPDNVPSTALDPRLEKHLAFYHFRNSLPPEIAGRVEPFTSRQWQLLMLCKKRERAMDLLEQNPALGFGVAHVHKFNPTLWEPLAAAAKITALRQRDMLRWIGFPKTQTWANILAKIPPADVTLEGLKSLGQVAAQPETEKQLQHLRTINGVVLALVSENRFTGLTTPTLLAELADSPDHAVPQEAFHLLEDIYILTRRLPGNLGRQPIPSLAALRNRHVLVREAFAKFLEHNSKETLPPPPLPGTPSIEPLVSTNDLILEGCQQHNCVGGYTQWVQDGRGYIYRVLAPERATLSIVKGPDGCWCIDQLKLAWNNPTQPATRQAVQAWLNQFSMSV